MKRESGTKVHHANIQASKVFHFFRSLALFLFKFIMFLLFFYINLKWNCRFLFLSSDYGLHLSKKSGIYLLWILNLIFICCLSNVYLPKHLYRLLLTLFEQHWVLDPCWKCSLMLLEVIFLAIFHFPCSCFWISQKTFHYPLNALLFNKRWSFFYMVLVSTRYCCY